MSVREKLGTIALYVVTMGGIAIMMIQWAKTMASLDAEQDASKIIYSRCIDGEYESCRDCAKNCFYSEQRIESARRVEPRQGRP